MNTLEGIKSVILVFAMPSCPACASYTPKLHRLVTGFQQHGVPLVYYDGKQTTPGTIPVVVLDAGSQDPQIQAYADNYRIEALPTTVLLTHNARPVKLEGDLDEQQIYEVLASATLANR